ncbi:MAG: hypothetical protein ACO3AC_08875 [Hylemonella sp.]
MYYRNIALMTVFTYSASAFAHEGHGISGAQHWHATDSWGLVAMALVIAVAAWLGRGGK